MAVKDFGGRVREGEQCRYTTCQGAVALGSLCLAHLGGEERDAFFAQLGALPQAERRVDLRGLGISPSLWSRLHRALAGVGAVENLLLDNATVTGDFDLNGLEVTGAFGASGVDFQKDVRIRGCRFANAFFAGSQFGGVARFGGVVFDAEASFNECTFLDFTFVGEGRGEKAVTAGAGLDFAGATFESAARFNASVEDTASFIGTRWMGSAGIVGSYRGDLVLHDAHFAGDLFLSGAEVDGTLHISDAQLDGFVYADQARAGSLSLRRATFSQAPEFGQMTVAGWAVLDQAHFERSVRLRILAEGIHCHRANFARGVSMWLAGELVADGTFFGPPSDISGVGISGTEGGFERGPARVLSLRRADVGGLSLANVDLSGCLFAGVHHLEGVRLGAGLRFGIPSGHRRSHRDVLAEEQWWRDFEEPDGEWKGPERLSPAWLSGGMSHPNAPATLAVDHTELPSPASIAETYRSLRHAREQSRDSPGAASFYYGEMEMRRAALRWPRRRSLLPERGVLWGYWLFSGYGLRAWRSLLTLLLLLALGSVVLWQLGFREAVGDVSAQHAVRVAVASATSLVRPIDDSDLNGVGFAVEIALRFAGPLLLALSALAVRARIKR